MSNKHLKTIELLNTLSRTGEPKLKQLITPDALATLLRSSSGDEERLGRKPNTLAETRLDFRNYRTTLQF